MSSVPPGRSLPVIWAPEAHADLIDLDRSSARQVLLCLDRYLTARHGDVKKLKPPLRGYRLRCGDYRLFFDALGDRSITITGLRHRRDAYR